nr:hypothetical protein [Thiocapsa sp. KS1]
MRTSAHDGIGPIIPGCHNVAVDDPTDTFMLGSYLTTWGSVYKEGTGAALVDGLGGDEMLGTLIDDALTVPRIFCKSYSASTRDVSFVVAEILGGVLRPVGYPILLSDQTNGMFETDYLYQMHTMARWRDRFSIDVSADGEHGAIVRVTREIAISRPDRGRYSDYFPATSVGRNEAWLLNEIARRL